MKDTLKTTSMNIVKYLIQDLNKEEKESYKEYINGNENSTDWMEKALDRREVLILKQIKCNRITGDKICKSDVNIHERGICKCNKCHIRNKQVISIINKLP